MIRPDDMPPVQSKNGCPDISEALRAALPPIILTTAVLGAVLGRAVSTKEAVSAGAIGTIPIAITRRFRS